jgi:hypothetical protein
VIERLASRMHVLRPLAFQASVVVTPILLLVGTLGLTGVVQAVLAEIASAAPLGFLRRGR